jgi:hypothetical protein
MPQAILTSTPSRRVLLGGSAALLAGAALTATQAVGTAAASPDAELIRLCDEHPRNIDAFNNSPFQGDAEDDPLWHAYERTRDAIYDAKPKTIAGMVAKARAAKAEAIQPDGSEHPANCPAEYWAWDLVNDLIRINGERP